jgi:hypothetical protein
MVERTFGFRIRVSESRLIYKQQLTRAALLSDYPWGDLGNATVIDIGCGAGDSGIDVLRTYPQLNWVFQDFGHVLKQVQKVRPDVPVAEVC